LKPGRDVDVELLGSVGDHAVEAGRKPRTGLKLRWPTLLECHGRVEAGRKPRTGLKQEERATSGKDEWSRQGENPERD